MKKITLIIANLLCFLFVYSASSFALNPSYSFHHQDSPPQDSREFFVDETKLPFTEIPGLPSRRDWGINKGAGFRIEVPENWNGELVVYTHGYAGEGLELLVDTPPLRAYYLSRGYAWLASSYSANYYDARAGLESTNSLVRYFLKHYDKPRRIYITGVSLGGHVLGAAIEQSPKLHCPKGRRGRICRRIERLITRFTGGVKYDGAAAYCGAMGDKELFQYFANFGFASEALAGVQSEFPPPADHFDRIFVPTLFGLYDNPEVLLAGNGNATLTPAGEKLRAFTTQLSGGERPLAEFAFSQYAPLLFSFNGADGTLEGVLPGSIISNKRTRFQLDGNPELSADETELNNSILRVSRSRKANPKQFMRSRRLPIITGKIDIPVISIHTTGDLFVPFSMEQIYAKKVMSKRRSHNLVSRATRAVGHCEFSEQELVETFDDLVTWVEDGKKPAGDNILAPDNVANTLFGCEFSRGSTPSRSLAPCPN